MNSRPPRPASLFHNGRIAVAALAAALTGAACGNPEPPPPGERSSLVLVTVSSLRADHLGIYGYPRNISPNLDLFGASGAVLLEALTPWPETGRGAAALLTGVDPSRSTRGEPARLREEGTLASLLRAHGYRTLGAVNHPALAAELGFGRGFDEFREHWGGDAAGGADAVRDFGVEALRAATGESPVFVWLHFSAPSPPHNPPAEDLDAVRTDEMTPAGPRFRGGPQPTAAVTGGAGYGELADRYGRIHPVGGPRRRRGAVEPRVQPACREGAARGGRAPRRISRRTRPTLRSAPRALPGDAPGSVAVRLARQRRVAVPRRNPLRFGGGHRRRRPDRIRADRGSAPETLPLGTIGKSLVPALRGDEPRPHRRLYAQSTRSGRSGSLRIRTPVASWIAFATAAGTGRCEGSPAP